MTTSVCGSCSSMLFFCRLFPDFVAGFDLVAQEDLGRPLLDFIGILPHISWINLLPDKKNCFSVLITVW
jgi:hypothetical protein